MKLFYPLGISYNFIWIFVCKRLVWQLGGFDALLRLSFHKITVLPLEDEACNLALGWAFLILFSPFYVIASSFCLFFFLPNPWTLIKMIRGPQTLTRTDLPYIELRIWQRFLKEAHMYPGKMHDFSRDMGQFQCRPS